MGNKSEIQHGLKPIIFDDSEVLILGSFPSEVSRETGQYYANDVNKFWDVIFSKYSESAYNYDGKIKILRKHKIALWDIIESCRIVGAKDNTITNEKYNDLAEFLSAHPSINKIILNGKGNFERLKDYKRAKGKYITTKTVVLVSTSPQGWNFANQTEHNKWYIELPD